MRPTPSQLFVLFERGEIERDEFHALMAVHARELIAEMEEDYQNPAAAWIERLLAKRMAGSLVKRHGDRVFREVLVALAEIPDFPPAGLLWNASHPDLPLHCFLRIRRRPIFKILSIVAQADSIAVKVEFGDAKRDETTRRSFVLKRDASWVLRAESIS
ncbi:MAG: hypothetical protein H8M99_02425 [Gloeobacteraceae cyanobacterium ES-bin-144]|nr:hypothetical protein [Verrucomicrobiales bacterium]